ncbi:MAG TPA: hypothetical protein VEM15_13200 [Thermodesulfobacteriota bacterium]|nr:hypothetical protein [Thermodesulfobacteriota bacterium]
MRHKSARYRSLWLEVMRAYSAYQGKSGKCGCSLIYSDKYSSDPKMVKEIDNWYFTYGDSDYTMW